MALVCLMMFLGEARNAPDERAIHVLVFGLADRHLDQRVFCLLHCAHEAIFYILQAPAAQPSARRALILSHFHFAGASHLRVY